MTMHPAAVQLIRDVDAASAGKLVHGDLLHAIIAAAVPAHETELFALAFKSKFLVRTWNVMKRLGADDPARAQLKNVFSDELEMVRTGIASLMAADTTGMRATLDRDFFAIDGNAFVRLLELLGDLAWVQNVKIDRAAGTQ